MFMLHKKDLYEKFVEVLQDHRIVCVHRTRTDLFLVNRSQSVNLQIDLSPLPEHAQYAKLDLKGGERYLQTKIRARVQRAQEHLLGIPLRNVRKKQ